MSKPRRPITPGSVFNRLTVLSYVGADKHGHSMYECECECGNRVTSIGSAIKSGHVKSCGCAQRESVSTRNTKHGHKRRGNAHPLYSVWMNMRDRCNNPRNKKYANYGGAGIRVCESWNESFEAFLADVGPRLVADFELDRIDPAGNYEPGNVRWISGSLQPSNTRRNVMVDWFGKKVPATVALSESGTSVAQSTFLNRLRKGMSLPDAMWSRV